jgi:DNA-binding GntR family transcriptional regulator
LQRLEAEHLVESRPRAGTRVRFPTTRDIEESYIVREALEVQSARLFTKHATAAQRRELLRKAERIDVLFNRLAKGETDPEFQYLVHSDHAQFHMFVAESTECERLFRLIEGNQVLILNWLYDVATRRRALPQRFHRDLAELLVQHDVLASGEAVRDHVRYGLQETLSNIQTQTADDWRRPRALQ